jgi:hypothetical protein
MITMSRNDCSSDTTFQIMVGELDTLFMNGIKIRIDRVMYIIIGTYMYKFAFYYPLNA